MIKVYLDKYDSDKKGRYFPVTFFIKDNDKKVIVLELIYDIIDDDLYEYGFTEKYPILRYGIDKPYDDWYTDEENCENPEDAVWRIFVYKDCDFKKILMEKHQNILNEEIMEELKILAKKEVISSIL